MTYGARQGRDVMRGPPTPCPGHTDTHIQTNPCPLPNLSTLATHGPHGARRGRDVTRGPPTPCPGHTHPFNGPLSGTTRVSRYQKGKTNLDVTEARDSEWLQLGYMQLGYMQVCTSLQTDSHASTPPLSIFYRPDALPAAQPTASKHQTHNSNYF